MSIESHFPYVLALLANLFFAFSCIIYTTFSRQFSSIWVNTLKSSVACLSFLGVIVLFYSWNPVSSMSLLALFVSGFIGLGIGDLFLLRAFSEIGAARTLLLFGFSPLFSGTMGYLFFSQDMSWEKFWAIFFLLGCLFTFSWEGFKKTGSWELKGIAFALLGVSFDAVGIGLTRFGFEDSPQMLPLEANFYRTIGALAAFFLLSFKMPIALVDHFKSLAPKRRLLILFASFTGTFLSLWCYLTALQVGHLATISAVAVTSPFFASIFESLYYRRWPSKYLYIAGALFAVGFSILIL